MSAGLPGRGCSRPRPGMPAGNHPGRMMPGRRRADTVTVNDQAQDGAMRNTQRSTGTQASTSGGGLQVRSGPLATGAALVGVGGLIALVGVAIGGVHLLSAVRQWVSGLEMPPTQLAKQKLCQAKAAAPPARPRGAG